MWSCNVEARAQGKGVSWGPALWTLCMSCSGAGRSRPHAHLSQTEEQQGRKAQSNLLASQNICSHWGGRSVNCMFSLCKSQEP